RASTDDAGAKSTMITPGAGRIILVRVKAARQCFSPACGCATMSHLSARAVTPRPVPRSITYHSANSLIRMPVGPINLGLQGKELLPRGHAGPNVQLRFGQ